MADLSQIERALVNADAAGDVPAAKALAAELIRLRGEGQQPESPKEPSLGSRIGRQLGLTARYAVEGAAALPSMVGDALGLDSSGAVSRTLDRIGLPRPDGSIERIAGDITRSMAGGATTMGIGGAMAGAASPVAQGVGSTLAAAPGLQTAGAITGSGASGITRESGGGSGAQLAAGLIGGIAPGVAVSAGAAATRGLLRGGEQGRQQLIDRTQTFRDSDVAPSVGQATGSRLAQATESALSRTPGSAGRMAAAGEQQAAEMGARINKLADDLIPNANSTKAGMTIERGVRNFVGRFKAEQESLFNKLDSYIPAQEAVDVSATRQTLTDLNADIPGAPALSKWFKNAKIQGIQGALESDVKIQEALPYEAVKKLRTLVGRELSDHTLSSDVPRSKWKALYAALSSDLESTAKAHGPQAEKAFARANWYTRAGHERIDGVLDRVSGRDTAEKVFQAAVNPSELKEGATTINAVMRSLVPEERKMVTAALVKRMGLATPGNQNELGDVFSSATFLTNWNKISPQAKQALFGGTHSPSLLKDLGKLSEAAAMVKEGAKVFANPSGTAQSMTNIGAGVAAALNPSMIPAILTGMAGANITARMMTSPKVVRWLAQTTSAPTSSLPSALNQLSQIASGDARLKADVDAYISSVTTPETAAQMPR